MNCEDCGAMGETCCQASRERRRSANSLAILVERQMEKIETLTRERDAARMIAEDLMKRAAV